MSGKLIGDIEIDLYNEYYETKVYVQNFTVGDYVRVSFHYIGYYNYMIQLLDYFNTLEIFL